MYEVQLSFTGGKIQAEVFLEGVSAFLRLLKSVDSSISGKETIRWGLSRLRYSSPATVGFFGEPKKNLDDNVRAVGATVLLGLEELDKGGKRPKGFADSALEQSKKLSDLKGRGGVHDLIVMDLNGAQSREIYISGRVAATVEDIIGPKFESYGLIEGKLELISSHGGMRCQIYQKSTGKPVKCVFPQEMKRMVIDGFDENVIAKGKLWRDASGHLREIELEQLQVLRGEEAPPESIAGIDPDITAGLDVVEYLKKRWE